MSNGTKNPNNLPSTNNEPYSTLKVRNTRDSNSLSVANTNMRKERPYDKNQLKSQETVSLKPTNL
uniref:Uncharacterized protein n=1 Tax=Rhizophora mucronata TaxID=61149 RepID=A0A2P2QJI9_RHIMU